MCIVTMETLDIIVNWENAIKSKPKRLLFGFLCYTVTAKRLFI